LVLEHLVVWQPKAISKGKKLRTVYGVFSLLVFSLTTWSVSPLYGLSPVAFFFDAKAFSVDADNDGGDDYIIVQFDVDLDENATANVTVISILYNQSDHVAATDQISYQVTGQEEGYTALRLTPNPDIEGSYCIYLALSDMSDELYIDDIYYNPDLGSEPVAYFADVMTFSEANAIKVQLDVNLVHQTDSDVRVEAVMTNSDGERISSQTLDYETFYQDVDYQQLSFSPPNEDAYSVVLLVFPGESEIASDSKTVQVLWPPGTGAHFRYYKAITLDDRIHVIFDVDLAYNLTYAFSVEAILYNSKSDVVGYSYTPYLTSGLSEDERTLVLVPEQTLASTYYMELIVYVENYPASYGYIEDISYEWPR
jgi:hypothetical protein